MPTVRLSAFYAAYFLLVGVLTPFWQLWLDWKGLTAVEIGTVLAATYWIKVAAHPTIARLADRSGNTRRLTAALALAAIAAFLALGFAQGFVAIVLLSAVAAATYNPILPVAESVAIRVVERAGADYGRVRMWGSITFILAAAGMGAVLAHTSPAVVQWAVTLAAVLLLASCLTLPELDRRPGRSAVARPWALLAEPRFWLFLAASGATSASHAVYYGFGTLHWRAIGIDETAIGLLWSVGVVAEIALFALAGRWRRQLSPVVLLSLAAAGGAVRWPLLAVLTDPWALAPVQALHALTFGAGHLGAMGFLRDNVPDESAATGQSLYYALVGGVLVGLVMQGAGLLFQAEGGGAYHVMGGLAALGVLLSLALAAAGPLRTGRG